MFNRSWKLIWIVLSAIVLLGLWWWYGRASGPEYAFSDYVISDVAIDDQKVTSAPIEVQLGKESYLTARVKVYDRQFRKVTPNQPSYLGFIAAAQMQVSQAQEIARLAMEPGFVDPVFYLQLSSPETNGWSLPNIVGGQVAVENTELADVVAIRALLPNPGVPGSYSLDLALLAPKKATADSTGQIPLREIVFWQHPITIITKASSSSVTH